MFPCLSRHSLFSVFIMINTLLGKWLCVSYIRQRSEVTALDFIDAESPKLIKHLKKTHLFSGTCQHNKTTSSNSVRVCKSAGRDTGALKKFSLVQFSFHMGNWCSFII